MPRKLYRIKRGKYFVQQDANSSTQITKYFFSRYEVLKLAYETLKNTEIEQQTIDTLEMAMWKSCILAGPENVQFDCNDYIFNKLKTELLSGLDRLQIACSLMDESEKNSVEILINKLIDLGKLDIALRISMMFNYSHKVSNILLFSSIK